MKLLCIAALLLSAVAEDSSSWKPWEDDMFLGDVANKLDRESQHGDGDQPMTTAPEHRDVTSDEDWPEGDSSHPAWFPGFLGDLLGELRFGPRRPFRRPSTRRPTPKCKLEFSPIFKVDNVTFQNITDVPLKEGENLFWVAKYPQPGTRGPYHHWGHRHGPPQDMPLQQYVKLLYNTTEPNQISLEYGVVKPVKLGQLVGQ
ncbi:uncharacterized protein LOC115048824 [Echeneis naucrates]|uniref:uncharacterized protein LOC115048824 n=1 Tax=Echeneis naucrates TaxID=173247 RepID=UPI00111447E4|nr:uncharacterized protein LOC115048824 [Echeneis naucrates]